MTQVRPHTRWAVSVAAAMATAVAFGGTADAAPDPAAPFVSATVPAAAQCGHPEVTPELLRAEVKDESGYVVRAVSPAGAQGPAQILPSQFAVFGGDDDGNGVASPFDVGDALGALARINCRAVTDLAARGHRTDPVSIIAAYKGGLGNVDTPAVRAMAQHTWDSRDGGQR